MGGGSLARTGGFWWWPGGCPLVAVSPQGISDGVALVQAVVPKNQAHSFITQGSPDVLVSTGKLRHGRMLLAQGDWDQIPGGLQWWELCHLHLHLCPGHRECQWLVGDP